MTFRRAVASAGFTTLICLGLACSSDSSRPNAPDAATAADAAGDVGAEAAPAGGDASGLEARDGFAGLDLGEARPTDAGRDQPGVPSPLDGASPSDGPLATSDGPATPMDAERAEAATSAMDGGEDGTDSANRTETAQPETAPDRRADASPDGASRDAVSDEPTAMPDTRRDDAATADLADTSSLPDTAPAPDLAAAQCWYCSCRCTCVGGYGQSSEIKDTMTPEAATTYCERSCTSSCSDKGGLTSASGSCYQSACPVPSDAGPWAAASTPHTGTALMGA